jgi:hypothetical protein
VGIALLAARLAPAKLSAGVERDALPVSGSCRRPNSNGTGEAAAEAVTTRAASARRA